MLTKITAANIQPGSITPDRLTGDLASVSGGPKITMVSILDGSNVVLDDTAVAPAGGKIRLTGSGFATGCVVIVGTTDSTSTTFISSNFVDAVVPPLAAGTYPVYLVNPDGGVALRVKGITYSSTPTWITGSQLFDQLVDSFISIQLSATSDSLVSYSVAAGSTLPPGLSLSSTGLLSGIVTGITSDTVYSFIVLATDQELQDSPRTFSLTVTAAPIPNNTHGWFGGGGLEVSRVDRITFASDTGTPLVRGPLSFERNRLAATGNRDFGWFGGGYGLFSNRSIVDRITFAADSGTASVRGPLSSAKRQLSATGNDDFGWFGGGTPNISTVDRITFAADTGTASVRGPLSLARSDLAATSNQNYGWVGGGGNPHVSTVDRITFSSDTSTASVRGPLSLGRFRLAATGNRDYGWFGGGGNPYVSIVDRITFSSDTSTASVRGPLNAARYHLAATGNENFGWFGGGGNPEISRVDRIDFAADTGTASARGSFGANRSMLAATGGII